MRFNIFSDQQFGRGLIRRTGVQKLAGKIERNSSFDADRRTRSGILVKLVLPIKKMFTFVTKTVIK